MSLDSKIKYDVVGVGNALVDIEILLSNEQFDSLNVVKNSMTLITSLERKKILEKMNSNSKNYSCGGAVGNTIYALKKKGNRVGMIGFVGNDYHGDKFLNELKEIGVEFLGNKLSGETGTCLVLITPDGNRTMLTTPGCASNLDSECLKKAVEEDNGKVDYYLIESYLLLGKENIYIIKKFINLLKDKYMKIILSDSDALCVEQEPEIYENLFGVVDIYFINGEQARMMKKLHRNHPIDVNVIGEEFAKKFPRPHTIVLTDNVNGAYIIQENTTYIPIVPTTVKDASGAGDAFAAGVIDGIINRLSVEEMGNQGARMASEVISHYGARW